MALLSPSHLSAVARNPNPLLLLSPHRNPASAASFYSAGRRFPRIASFPAPSATYGGEGRGGVPGEGRRKRHKHPKEKPSEDEGEDPQGVAAGPGGRPAAAPGIPDEWGERAELEPERPAEVPQGVAAGPGGPPAAAPGIPDEWGERAELEPEPPAEPDPPKDEDEWGRDPGNGGGQGPQAEDKLGDLKRCLVDTFYGTDYGLRASAEVRAEVLELVGQLETENPTPAPMEAPELLDGNWILLYTAFSELLPLIAVGTTPLLKVKGISQAIDTKSSTIINSTTLASPFASFSFSASASFEVRSPSRIQVRFKEGTFDPPVISSSVDLPENVDVFGQKIDLLPVQRTLNPVQEAVANIARAISGQPPLKVQIPGDRTASWLLTTYLDKDLRISRGDGGLFVLAKEGSPLLDQLS